MSQFYGQSRGRRNRRCRMVWMMRPAIASLVMCGQLSLLSVVVSFHHNMNALLFFVPAGALGYLMTLLILPGGKTMLHELSPDFVQRLGRKLALATRLAPE